MQTTGSPSWSTWREAPNVVLHRAHGEPTSPVEPAARTGHGQSVGSIDDRFIHGGYHSANTLNSSYNYIGVGVTHGSDGKGYVAQVFGGR